MTTRTRLPPDFEALVIARVTDWIKAARRIQAVGARRLPVPDVSFDLRGRAAGQAVFAARRRGADRIRFNADLLLAHPDEMLGETVPHEVAHVAVARCSGRHAAAHGAEWRDLMAAFGVAARTCHRLPAKPTRRLRRFAYRCGCAKPAWLTSIRHNRARRGERYRCRCCGKLLAYAPDIAEA